MWLVDHSHAVQLLPENIDSALQAGLPHNILITSDDALLELDIEPCDYQIPKWRLKNGLREGKQQSLSRIGLVNRMIILKVS